MVSLQTVCLQKNSLKSFDISQLEFLNSPGFRQRLGYIYGMNNLEVLFLNKMDNFSFKLIPDSTQHVQRLYMSQNIFNFTEIYGICQVFPNLIFLDISILRNSELPASFFSGCHKLQFLNMSFSNIIHFDSITLKTFDEIQEKAKNFSLDLSGNVLACACHEKHTSTIHWLRHTDVTIVNFEQLQCVGSNGKELIHTKDLIAYYKHCSVVDEILISVFSAVLAVIVTVVVMCIYRKRRTLQTYWYKQKLFVKGFKSETFDFDVYFCYVHEDDQKVENIRHFLEEECRLKCCIPQRNFSDQFTDDFDQAELNMMKSASTVVFLSFAAINNHQHRVERYQARHVELKRSFEHRVVYVALDDLRDVTRAGDDLHTILRYREYLQWKEDAGPRQEAAFKGRLLKKVYGGISISRD